MVNVEIKINLGTEDGLKEFNRIQKGINMALCIKDFTEMPDALIRSGKELTPEILEKYIQDVLTTNNVNIIELL